MDLDCEYCFERFDINERLPYDLDCEHIICYLCVKETKKTIPAPFCPLHRTELGLMPTVNTAILNHLKQICAAHFKPISFLCLNHYELLCENCALDHKPCKLLRGDLSNLDKQLTQLIDEKKESMKHELEKYSRNLISGYSENLAMIQTETEKYLKITGEVLQITSEMPLQKRLKSLISTQAIELIDIPHLTSSTNCFESLFSFGIFNSLITRFNLETKLFEILSYSFPHPVLLMFSSFLEVNKKKFSNSFTNLSDYDIEITGLGVGLPVDTNQSICYEYIRIYEGSSKINLISEVRNQVVTWEQDKIVTDLTLPIPFKLRAGEIIMIKLQILGEKLFSFFIPLSGPILPIDNEFDDIPIFYLNFENRANLN